MLTEQEIARAGNIRRMLRSGGRKHFATSHWGWVQYWVHDGKVWADYWTSNSIPELLTADYYEFCAKAPRDLPAFRWSR